jgi:hypothetical protein
MRNRNTLRLRGSRSLLVGAVAVSGFSRPGFVTNNLLTPTVQLCILARSRFITDFHMKIRLASILCLALLSLTFSAEAKKKPAPDPAADAPSARLSRFMKAHLDEVLAPLDKKGLRDAQAITELRESFAGAAAKSPPAQRASYRTAEDVCQAMANAYAERERSISNLKSSSAAQKTRWQKRADLYREQIGQLYARQRETERQFDAAISAAAAESAATPAAPLPPPPLPPIVDTLPPPQMVAPGSSPATPSIER